MNIFYGIVVLVILSVIGGALLSTVAAPYTATGAFSNATCGTWNTTQPGFPGNNATVANCVSNSYTGMNALVSTIAILSFVVVMVAVAIAMFRKHR